jgi:hypothetical protein
LFIGTTPNEAANSCFEIFGSRLSILKSQTPDRFRICSTQEK